jgi:hypothetical protein
MRQFADTLRIPTPGRGLVEITRDVVDWLQPCRMRTGCLTLFCRHTSAGLLIQENAARDVRADLETFFERIAPDEAGMSRALLKFARQALRVDGLCGDWLVVKGGLGMFGAMRRQRGAQGGQLLVGLELSEALGLAHGGAGPT